MHCDTFASVNNALLQMHCWLYSTHAQLGPEPRPNDFTDRKPRLTPWYHPSVYPQHLPPFEFLHKCETIAPLFDPSPTS